MKAKNNEIISLINKAINEDAQCLVNTNLLCGYIWKYQGAEEEMEFGEFIRGLIEERFTHQGKIVKCLKSVKSIEKIQL